MMMENGLSMEYGDGYMEQEEEWEREGLLDPAWEKQQKKVSEREDNAHLPNLRIPLMLLYPNIPKALELWSILPFYQQIPTLDTNFKAHTLLNRLVLPPH